MKYCHFFPVFRLKPARFVFENPNKEPEYEEHVEISDEHVSEGLRSQYESAKDEVEKRIKRYESNPNYKVFVDYAKGRLAQCDRDLKQYDALTPKQVRDNLVKLENILFKARQDEVNDKKDEVLAEISARRKHYLEMFATRLKEQEAQLEDMPKTLLLARKLNGSAVIKVGMLFNDRIRMVSTSVAKQMNGVGDRDIMADTTLDYLDSISKSLTSETDEGSANAEAKKLYEDYDKEVTGEYLVEKAQDGNIDAEIQLVCAGYLIEKDGEGNPHIRNSDFAHELHELEKDYLSAVASCKGDQAYKKVAVIYGDFLNQFNELRDKYFPDEKTKGRRDFHEAVLARTDAARTEWEKGWEDAGKGPDYKLTTYVPAAEGVVSSGISLHIGPEDPDLAGIVTDMVRAGTKVKVAEGEPLKVKGVEYVHVQVLNAQGQVVNEGWVNKSGISYKYGVKTEKSVENKGTTNA